MLTHVGLKYRDRRAAFCQPITYAKISAECTANRLRSWQALRPVPSTTPDSARGMKAFAPAMLPLDAAVSAARAVLIPLPDRGVLPGICPLSSPRGSIARGSSDIRIALAFARSLGCASEERSVDLCDRDIGMSRDSTGLPYMHAARSPGSCRAGTRPPDGAARAPVFF